MSNEVNDFGFTNAFGTKEEVTIKGTPNDLYCQIEDVEQNFEYRVMVVDIPKMIESLNAVYQVAIKQGLIDA